jgi:hypothetical protein
MWGRRMELKLRLVKPEYLDFDVFFPKEQL